MPDTSSSGELTSLPEEDSFCYRSLSLLKCFPFLFQTQFDLVGLYKVIPSLLLDDCLQYLRRFLSVFSGVVWPVPWCVLHVKSWLQILTYPVCSIRMQVNLAISFLMTSIQNWMLCLPQAHNFLPYSSREDNTIFPKKIAWILIVKMH